MKRNNRIIIGVSFFIVLFYGIYIYLNWNYIKTNINAITVSDIVDNILTLMIGVVIAYLFSVYYANRHKQYELMNSIMDMYVNDLGMAVSKIQQQIQCSERFNTVSFNRDIQHLLRIGSNDLNTFIEMSKKLDSRESDLQKYKNSFFEFKVALTNKQFENVEELERSFDEIVRCYYIIKNDIHMMKLSFYN